MPEKSIQRRAVLYFPEYTFDISDINEDMVQSSAVSPVTADADFAIGVSSMSELKFSLNNLYGVISENSLANKEFLLQRGEVTEYESVLDVYKKVRKPLFIQHGGFTFAGNDRVPYLSVYDSSFALQDAPAQPSHPVKSLFIVGGKLYCVHDIDPAVTAYSVSGGTLKMLPQTKLTPFFERKMTQEYAKRGRCFNKQGNTVTEYVSVFTDMKISDVIKETWEYSNFGYYIVTNPEKINDIKISVLAYDRMKKFEVVADGFLDSVTYPIPLKSLLTKLCEFVGVGFNNRTLLNETYSVPRNFKTDGVTCRQVLQWIAQISANFAYIDFDGNLNISWYTNADSKIDASNSTVIDIADYVVKPIDKVNVRAFETDIGVIVPIDERKPNAYIIENNPLLYATEDAQIRPAVTNIYNAIKAFSYIPFTAKVRVVDENVKAGMVMSATTIKGTKFNAYVMQSTLKGVKGLAAEYSAIGNERRKVQTDAVNQRIVMLNGRTNSTVATVDEFGVTLTEVKTETQKNTSDVNAIGSRVSTAETKIAQNAEQIELRAAKTIVESLGDDLADTNSKLSQFTQSVTGDLSSLQAQVDGQIESWFYPYTPTLNNLPASGWKTPAEKDKHLGDLFYNSETGSGYRFSKISNVYSWEILKDTEIGKALADAQKAQDTADGKRRVFVTQPIPPYDIGDLWANATYSTQYTNDLLRCKTAKSQGGIFTISDWEKASKYTDDSKANEVEQRVITAETSIIQNAKEIALKANLATVESIEGRVSSAESSIMLNANEINSRVSYSEYNGNTISSLINQTATSILIQASKINLVGYVTATDLTTGNLTVTGKLESIYGSEKISMFNGYIELYYSNSLRGSLYTNSNNRQEICLSSKSGSLLFASGGYLRGRILRDGTFDNQQYDFKTSGDFYMTGYYYADGYRGYSGSFKNSEGRTVTVKKGIITGVL